MAEPAQDLELAEQTELFDLSRLPVRNDLVEMVKKRSFLPAVPPSKKLFKHTGKIIIRRLLNDEELCEGICTAILARVSARLIGMRFAISPKSVVSIREAMEDRGELAPVRTRILRALDQVTEVGLETVLDGLLAGQIPAGSAWIPALASIDKREQMSVGLVPGTERTRASVTTEQVLAEHALAMSGLKPSDSQSPAQHGQPAGNQAKQAMPGHAATVPATAEATLDVVATTPARTARDGGGGVAIQPPPAQARGDGPGNSAP